MGTVSIEDFMQKEDLEKGIFMRRTLASEISYSGVGLFTGSVCTVRMSPCHAGKGIRFKQVGSKEEVLAVTAHVISTERCVVLGKGSSQFICVEHILSALKGFEIDDALIEMDGLEMPIGDGSANWIAALLHEAGSISTSISSELVYLQEPIHFIKDQVVLIAIPAEQIQYSYALRYPGHPILDGQFYSYQQNVDTYKREIAPCRTFATFAEVEKLLQGKVLGGTLDRAVVIKDNEVLNPGGFRFPNECARHKLLDLMGDLSLLGCRLVAHFIAIRSGHATNVEFAKWIEKRIQKG